MVILYNIFNIMEIIASAYLCHGECGGAHLPVGRGGNWDATKTLQSSVGMRGAGMKFLELVILRQELLRQRLCEESNSRNVKRSSLGENQSLEKCMALLEKNEEVTLMTEDVTRAERMK